MKIAPSLSPADFCNTICQQQTSLEATEREWTPLAALFRSVARILLVEDDPGVRPFLEDVLNEQGYEVAAVEDMASAVALLGTQPFDLVVTDMHLPDGSGLKVADKAQDIGVRALVITVYG